MAVYGASKAFVLNFTEALWAEARGSGLTVLAVCPGPTRTEFFDVVGSEDAAVGRMQTATQVVDTAFRALDRRYAPPTSYRDCRTGCPRSALASQPAGWAR